MVVVVAPSVFSYLASAPAAPTLPDVKNLLPLNSQSILSEQDAITLLGRGADGQAHGSDSRTSDTSAQKPYFWNIAIYPALAWAPIFGASVTLPPLPSQPITTPGPSGSTDNSLNGAFFGGARFEKGKWAADLLFMWAAVSAERETPFTKVNLDFVFGDVMAGREILPGFYVDGGARRLALDIKATVGSSSASRSPGFWDPLIGVTYRRQLGEMADSAPR